MLNNVSAINSHTDIKIITENVYLPRLASFGQLCLISDPDVHFQKSRNGFNDHKCSKVYYTTVKYEKTFHGRYIAFNTLCGKDKHILLG